MQQCHSLLIDSFALDATAIYQTLNPSSALFSRYFPRKVLVVCSNSCQQQVFYENNCCGFALTVFMPITMYIIYCQKCSALSWLIFLDLSHKAEKIQFLPVFLSPWKPSFSVNLELKYTKYRILCVLWQIHIGIKNMHNLFFFFLPEKIWTTVNAKFLSIPTYQCS